MRIIHTSDWHLGQSFYGKNRAHEHKQFLAWLLAEVEQQQVDMVILAGDVFDTNTPPSYAREMYFDFIVQMQRLKCQFVVVAGNHDSAAMLGESKQLLAHLTTRVVPNIAGELAEQVFYALDTQGQPQAVICAIPYLRPKELVISEAGQSATEKSTALQQGISQHYARLFDYAKKLAELDNSQTSLPIIATGHLTTVGASISESVRELYIGTLEAFPASAFPAFDYIALGHIHRHQQVANSQHIRYSGSPIALSFDEAKQKKSVLLVEFTQIEQKTSPQISQVFVPCFQPLHMLKSDLEHIEEKLTALLASDELIAQLTCLENTNIWLDIEIETNDYLPDLQNRIETILTDLPIEMLLLRRCKKSWSGLSLQQNNKTLNELSLLEVFNSRLSQEICETTKEIARKDRITTLFHQTVADVKQAQDHSSQSSDELVSETI